MRYFGEYSHRRRGERKKQRQAALLDVLLPDDADDTPKPSKTWAALDEVGRMLGGRLKSLRPK